MQPITILCSQNNNNSSTTTTTNDGRIIKSKKKNFLRRVFSSRIFWHLNVVSIQIVSCWMNIAFLWFYVYRRSSVVRTTNIEFSFLRELKNPIFQYFLFKSFFSHFFLYSLLEGYSGFFFHSIFISLGITRNNNKKKNKVKRRSCCLRSYIFYSIAIAFNFSFYSFIRKFALNICASNWSCQFRNFL